MIRTNKDENAIQLFLDEHNPFMLKDEKGKVMYFVNYVEAYRELLNRFRVFYPRGYIELELFLVDVYEFRFQEALDDVTSMKRRGLVNPCLIDWSDIESYKSECAMLCMHMHYLTETRFKVDQFNLAFIGFSQQLKDGSITKNH